MYRFCLILLAVYLNMAPVLASLESASFSELIKSDMVYPNNEEVGRIEAELWQKYIDSAMNDVERKGQHDRRELTYRDKIMKFSLQKEGDADATGYPVFIALHGGGGAPAYVNDSQWEHMKVYYLDSVQHGIYVAPRGISNTWDLHFQAESYPLYDRLIENLIVYEGADPNRIYLLGFSAGGDGVYQIVPRMPDRFAAANMSAGHHNWIRFDNLFNTPFLMQVGELDQAYDRNRVAAQNFLTLNDLQQRYQGYVHDLFIHHGRGHNGWYDNEAHNRNQVIIKDPKAWLNAGDRSQIRVNTNAVSWLKRHNRPHFPRQLIWDLGTRASRSKTFGANYVEDAAGLSDNKNLFYWLALPDNNIQEGRIVADIDERENKIYLKEVTGVDRLSILLRRDVFDFANPIAVYYKDQKIAEIQPQVQLNVMAQSLLERGDPALIFHSKIDVDLTTAITSMNTDAKFSYCSNGQCKILSAADFHKLKKFPLDLNYHCKNDHHYALTFDDGPSDNFPALLDILRRHQVTATFFVVGKNLENDEGKRLVLNAHQAGHQIANHTFTHPSLTDLSEGQIYSEVEITHKLITSIVGDDFGASKIVRPPFGNIDDEVQNILKAAGYTSVRWNSDRYDWQLGANDQELVKNRFKQHLDLIQGLPSNTDVNRSILDLNHDHSLATLSVLDEVIPMIKAAGYDFVSVKECLGL